MKAVIKPAIAFLLTIVPGMVMVAQVETHLYLFNVEQKEDCYTVSDPRLISSFNYCGYTDHPSFTPLGDILVSARLHGEDQHDVWLLSPETNSCKRLTQTTADEYAPRVTPDGRYYSVVRQVDGDSATRQVWQFPVFGGKYKAVTPKQKGIRSYAWINENELGLFYRDGNTQQLATYNRTTQRSSRLITSLATTIISDRMGSLYYIQQQNGSPWYLRQYTHETQDFNLLEETPVKSEVFVVTPSGTFFMGKDSRIYSYQAGAETTWKECADLAAYGIHHISRLAISPDGKQMAVVALCVD